VLIWYISSTCKQNAWTDASILSTRIKAALSMLLYSKISKLTLYVMKSSEIGKITNLLSSDLAVIGLRLSAFLNALIFPIVLIGSTTLLIIRLGWPGALGTTIVLLIIPVFNFISKLNGKILQEINVHKDKRIKATA
jgi:ABC-type transport system involved in cytochrome bd biosynthesis fused ATPase/permease subunit